MSGVGTDERTNGHGEIVEIDLDALLDDLMSVDTAVPTEDEAAAIVSAIATHLTDRAGVAAQARDGTAGTVSPWTFSGRLDRVGAPTRRRPRTVDRGEEWQAAARLQ